MGLQVRGGHTALLQHFAANEACSVNTRDKNGASPLHLAAEFNQPKAAQFLMRHCAFVDAVDASGRSALQIANERRWREMQRVLQDHALLFWNRAARANKLYKATEVSPNPLSRTRTRTLTRTRTRTRTLALTLALA